MVKTERIVMNKERLISVAAVRVCKETVDSCLLL